MMSDAKPLKPVPPGTVFPLRTVFVPAPKITPAWIREKAESEVRHVTEFLRMIEEKYEDDEAELRFRITRDEIEFDHDDFWLLDEIRYLSRQLALVALYRVVEQNTRTILRTRLGEKEVDDHDLYRINNLKKWLDLELGVNLEGVPGFDLIDELRLVNNAVKHDGGNVSDRLATKYPRWGKNGNPLHPNVLPVFNAQVAAEVPNYLRALAEAVIP